MKCPSPPGAVPAANAAAAGGTRLPHARPSARAGPVRRLRGRSRCGPGRGAGAGLRRGSLCAGPRSGGTRARPPPARRCGAPGRRPRKGCPGTVGLRSRRRPGRLHFVREAGQGAGGGRDSDPWLRPCPLGLAAARGSPGSSPLPPAEACGAGPLCLPRRPGRRAAGGRQALGAGRGLGWASPGAARQGVSAGLTGRPGCGAGASPRTFVGRKRGPREEGIGLVSPQSGLHEKNAAIWRLAVPGFAPKAGTGQGLAAQPGALEGP
ncbi:nuclear transcription factor Y subunit beta isoform X2 [Desmodus rotundus]|uniref:nuclear transcription factor Y subunit beta isoform X2 n=1 Tax=Desmodus rotundus TaxID=9430 RepID=UPI0023813BE0|nr:nuclear transcription factor Y subunit beta isoform X2 [Desmodus rotundus]